MKEYIFISHSIVEDTKNNVARQGKYSLEPLRSSAKAHGVPLAMLEDTDISNEAEVHITKADLWQCIEGEATFTIGGEMIDPYMKKNSQDREDPNELLAKEIKGGAEQVVQQGDWLWIPAGIAHQHRAKGTARFFVIKVPQI